VKILKKAIGFAAVGGLVAGGIALAAPTSNAAVTSVGSCSGTKGIGTAKSTVINPATTKPYGVSDNNNQDVTVGIKGVPNPSTGTNFGSCTFASGLSTPDGSKPPIKGYNGTKPLTKWGAKLFSPEADCLTSDTGDTTEWPINGKLSVAFADTFKGDGWISVDGFTDPDNDPLTPSDVVASHGLQIKGVAAGADIRADVYFDPAIKDKTQTTETPYPGYQFNIAAALGCTDATPDNADITLFISGDGTSLLLALPAPGITMTIGS
jgi:hypothetical protein